MDDAFVERRGDVLRVRLPSYDRFARGAQLAFGLAPALVLAVWIAGWLLGLSSAVEVAIASAIAAGLGGPTALLGLGLALTARRRAARSEVVVDPAERLIRRPGAAPEVLRSPRTVRVARARLGAWRLELVDAEGRATVLVPRAPRASGPRLARAAEAIAGVLDAKVDAADAEGARGLVPSSTRTYAALCQAPVDGLLVAYSLWALATSRDRFVRFAAKQSLALFALEFGLLFATLGCVGAPLALLVDAAGVRALGIGCPLAVLALARVALRVTAAVRANRGEVWIVPAIAPLARRWAPGQPSSSRRSDTR